MSERETPKVSFVLLDWSVRESFHILQYLRNQTCSRDDFEVIIIEYYDREYEGVKSEVDQVDTWLLLDMPHEAYYHKHLMYNAGLVVSRGEIISIGDSDAMVKPSFVETIINHFEANPDSVLHIDQFRNGRKDLYPFNYPAFEEITGEGCTNCVNGRTTGVEHVSDPIHKRNYGACMCARREALINIGGADEHQDYVGHICGPYDMTFRMMNDGHEEIWSREEFTYHAWHPGQAGDDNYLGPHDGRHMSTTALMALVSGRVRPLVENRSIKLLRENGSVAQDHLLTSLIDREAAKTWNRNDLKKARRAPGKIDERNLVDSYFGARILQDEQGYTCQWIAGWPADHDVNDDVSQHFATVDDAKQAVVRSSPKIIRRLIGLHECVVRTCAMGIALRRLMRDVMRLSPHRLTEYRQRVAVEFGAHNIFLFGRADLVVFVVRNRNDYSRTRTTIAVSSYLSRFALSILMTLRIVPPQDVVCVKDVRRAKDVSMTVSSGEGVLWVPAKLYVKFCSAFNTCGVNRLVVI